MSIKTIVNHVKTEEYPKLMVDHKCDLVVLFNGPSTGMVIENRGHEYVVGEYCSDWLMSNFTTFDGALTLSNA